MFKFNNIHIFTGYLKQLLKDFNLPKYKIYTKEQEKYFNEHKQELNVIGTVVKNNDYVDITKGIKSSYPTHMRYIPYIRHNKIQEYIINSDTNVGEWVNVGEYWQNDIPTKENGEVIYRNNALQLNNAHNHIYNYGDKYLNYTKNLIIKDNIYDSYTHEYLGDYLRFLRDYNNLNLMPLYNCFSNRLCDSLYIKTSKALFDTTNTAYKIYMLPVKLFQKYTIAIDSDLPVEFCCAVYGDYQDKREKFKDIPERTYAKVSCAKFSNQFIYDKLLNLTENINNFTQENTNYLVDLAQNEDDLKLFIKVPQANTSTIVILEGDYRYWNDEITTINSIRNANNTIIGYDTVKQSNHTVCNFEALDKYEDPKLITNLQLLQFNTKIQVPFADRLVEYLIGNVITNLDDNGDNVERAQTVMALNEYKLQEAGKLFSLPGLWEDKMRILAYTYIQSHCNKPDINHDILGYIDKDVEKNYMYKGETSSVTISNVDIYDEEVFIRRIRNYGNK